MIVDEASAQQGRCAGATPHCCDDQAKYSGRVIEDERMVVGDRPALNHRRYRDQEKPIESRKDNRENAVVNVPQTPNAIPQHELSKAYVLDACAVSFVKLGL